MFENTPQNGRVLFEDAFCFRVRVDEKRFDVTKYNHVISPPELSSMSGD